MTAASAARLPPADAIRRRQPFTLANLTPFAPGVAVDAPLSSPDRCMEFWSATPIQALREILNRIGRRADDVESRPDGADTVLLARVGRATVPLAFIGEELPPTVVSEALAAIRKGAF